MAGLHRILWHGALLSALASLLLVVTLRFNPRLYLQDYPPAIQALVPQRTAEEKRWTMVLGLPFLLLLVAVPLWSTAELRNRQPTLGFFALALNAGGVAWVFNWIDWLLLDWWMFCTITPSLVVIPGSEGSPAYKDYRFHFRGFLIGTLFSALAGLAVAALVVWLA